MGKRMLVFETIKGVAMISLENLFSVEVVSTEDDDRLGTVSKVLIKFLLPDSNVHTEVYNLPTNQVKSLLQQIVERVGES